MLLVFAYNLALLGNNLETVEKHCKKLMRVAGKVGLKFNDKKKSGICNNWTEK